MSFIPTAGGIRRWRIRPPIGPFELVSGRMFKFHKYVCIGTLEEKIDELIESKARIGRSDRRTGKAG